MGIPSISAAKVDAHKGDGNPVNRTLPRSEGARRWSDLLRALVATAAVLAVVAVASIVLGPGPSREGAGTHQASNSAPAGVQVGDGDDGLAVAATLAGEFSVLDSTAASRHVDQGD